MSFVTYPGVDRPHLNTRGWRYDMYAISEYLAIAGTVVVLGAGLFAAVALVVLTQAAVRGLAQRVRQAASQAAAAVAELKTNAVAESVRH
jgi:hypothetical protein